jgi:hypothetical protein
MSDPPIKLRAHPAHGDDILWAAEQVAPAAMLGDARGEADDRQSLQFFD